MPQTLWVPVSAWNGSLEQVEPWTFYNTEFQGLYVTPDKRLAPSLCQARVSHFSVNSTRGLLTLDRPQE
ncbi:hypothetical protein T4D_10984 [Trichinella pseudospiralis]|uniref:Uncharacterized protein n=1 Tax=Trichinella pseudospiralis TaxID=6337 RepID=A0A0V1F2A7_TRIPS|nr:hypothetical protein T4D_10984 [Trichinella pseudospiralis]